jgi:hypothetical protein
MNRTEYSILLDAMIPPQIDSYAFREGPRMLTLLLGYTCDRSTFHVYLKDSLIHRLVFDEKAQGSVVRSYDYFRAWDALRLVPDKRVYPESTTALMALLLKRSGADVPYLPFDDNRFKRVENFHLHASIREEIG